MTSTAITATVTKPTVDSKVGIDFEKQADGRVYIAYIAGLFAETNLKVGYEVISLNGKPVFGVNPLELKGMIGVTEGDVTVVAVPATMTSTAGTTTTGNRAPPNLPEGGVLGVYKFVGPETKRNACLVCLCLGIFGLCFLNCPTDQQDAYVVNNKVYDASGKLIDPILKKDRFVPTRTR